MTLKINPHISRLPLFILSLLILFGGALPSYADKHDFREKFIQYNNAIQFKKLQQLIKKNKDLVLIEVGKIVNEAGEENRRFEEKMYLLNLANKMLLFYRDFYPGGDNILKEIRNYQSELKLEYKKTTKKLMKWEKLEQITGNFVMKKNIEKMKEADVKPVLFPHWLHRIWFQCSVCHDDIFKMERWSNDITEKNMTEGKFCGRCHNKEVAFGRENCQKCHMAGEPEGEHLHNMSKVDHKRIKKVADRVGAEWNPEKLEDMKLPLDRFGYINWIELRDKGIINPLRSLDKGAKEEIRDNKILFKTKSSAVNNVLFDHKIHSSWMKCSSCHPGIFKEELGATIINMPDMVAGMNCGHCHGRVSFKFADCTRCHSQPKGQDVPEGVLVR